MSYTEILSSELSKQKNVIYKITNSFDDKTYIGQTKKSLRDRLAQHIWQMKNDSTHFHRALAKYGISNFDIQIIDISKNNKPYVIINNCKWMLYDKFNKKYRKVEDELS